MANNSRPQMTLTEVCRRVGIHKSKGYSILTTLNQFGLVEKDPVSKTYRLGYGLLYLSRKVLDNLDYRLLAAPHLEELSAKTGSTALLGIISAEQVFVAAKHESDRPIGVTIRIGHRFHFTAGAHGKAIVAFMPEEKREEVLARERLYFYGDGCVPPRRMKALREELCRIRRDGFAFDLGGLQPGVSAVASPVIGPGDEVIGCLILIGTFPKNVLDGYGGLTAQAAGRLSARLGA